MPTSIVLVIRTLLVLAVLALMPLMALPPVCATAKVWWQKLTESRETEHDLPYSQNVAGRPTDPLPGRNGFGEPGNAVGMNSHFGASRAVEPQTTSRLADEHRLQQIHRRLRELGVTYTRLETVGKEGRLYRFQCLVPVGNSVYTRTFERSAADPISVMEHVLKEVEVWYSVRQPAGDKDVWLSETDNR